MTNMLELKIEKLGSEGDGISRHDGKPVFVANTLPGETVRIDGELPRPELVERARRTGARIVAPTGALLGLDAVRAAAEGVIHSVQMTTRKPPGGLAGAPHLVNNNISVEGLTEAKLVFEGSAREGAIGFPANVNVAAALALAGVGPDATSLQVWADPGVTKNCHSIEVKSDS